LSEITVTFNNDIIKGQLILNSIAPAHYADGLPLDDPKASPLYSPSSYWFNAIPAEIANVNFTVYGEKFEFQGYGYQDKNWGGLGFAGMAWYWGRATVGPYSLVWVSGSDRNGGQYETSYLVKNGEVLISGLYTPFTTTNNFGIVLPFGNNTQYPAEPNSTLPSGFLLSFVGNCGQQWSFLAKPTFVADNVEDAYTRWIGTVSGGEVGGESEHGSGVWEWWRMFYYQ